MKTLLTAVAFSLVAVTSSAQDTIVNPAINPDTVQQLQERITALESQLSNAQTFVDDRRPDVLELSKKIEFADEDTDKIISDLKALVDEFKTGSEIQTAVNKSMQDVRVYIDQFRAGTAAQQAAAKSLQETLTNMEETDARRNDLVGKALSDIRRLEAMKGDMVAFRIAGAFKQMGELYDEMVAEFEATVNETSAVADSLEAMTSLPVE